MSNDRIPDLMKLGEIETDMEQVVSTDIIDASVISQSFARFTLDRRVGFLHSNSKLTVALTPLTNTTSFFPFSVGAHNLVKKCRLLIGQKEIASTDDYAWLNCYQSQFITNENNKERQLYVDGRAICHENVYDSIGSLESSTVGLDLGNSGLTTGAIGAETTDTTIPHFMNMNATNPEQAPVYSIFLSELFPMLRTFVLPCYMIDEPIFIEISWQDSVSSLSGAANSLRACTSSVGTANVAYQIDTNEVKLIYDSISYSGDIMEKYKQQNPSISFQFSEYSLAKRTGLDTAFTGLKFNVGGKGRLCSRVIYGLQPDADILSRSFCNSYRGNAPSAGNNLTMNLLYNDRYLFSQDRSNNALLFSTTQQSEGAVPMLLRQEYSNEVIATITADTIQGMSQRDNLSGDFFWNSVRLNRSERINNQGITLEYANAGLTGAETYTLRVWVESLKVATIKEGKFDCYFA
jgi:hypothetical protein